MRRWTTILLFGAAIGLAACDEQPTDGPDAAAAKAPAALQLQFTNLHYEIADGRHRYNHVRQFRETAGTGVTLNRGRVCVLDGQDCAETLVNYRIEPSATLEQTGHYVATTAPVDRIIFQYWGVDDGGRAVELVQAVAVDNGNWAPLPN